MMHRLAVILLGLLLITTLLPAGQKKIEVPLRFDSYYDDEEVLQALKALNRAYPALTVLEEVGRSEEDRPIMCLTINNPQTGHHLEKPAAYVDGNIHGNEIQAGEVCLYLADYLLGQYGRNQRLTELLDRAVFYIVPVVNMDGRHHFFKGLASAGGGNRSLRIPSDDDHDGLVDEDPPDDLDGDGTIAMMRIPDPLGQWKSDPEDSRLMVRVKPGERGEWRLLDEEGIDNDGDGDINEDGEGYVDGNRNWGHNWQPPYVQVGSGDYPFSGVGIRALAQFIRQRPNICLAWAFHNSGGMILRGPSAKEQGEYSRDDLETYNFLGQTAEKMLPGYRYMISWKDLYTTYGDFLEWMNNINGTVGFVGELFNRSVQETFRSHEEMKKPPQDEDFFSGSRTERLREQLKFSDHLVHGELYKPWKKVKHPTYGEVEVGGWVKMSSRLPAPFMIKDMVHRNAAAVIFTAEHLPDVSLEKIEVMPMQNGLSRVRVRLRNLRAIPTMTDLFKKAGISPQDMLRASGMKVVAAGIVTDEFSHRVNYVEHRPELQFLTIPGFGVRVYDFLVSGSGTLKLEYRSAHARNRQLSVRVGSAQ